MSVHFSHGLLPVLHVCPKHCCALKQRTEKTPFVDGYEHKRAMRIVFFCPRKDCHWVETGKQEYTPTPYQARQEKRGGRWLTQF